MRRAALVALWVLATIGALSLARFAVSVVADEVTVRREAPLSADAVGAALAENDATSSTTTTAGPAGGAATPPTTATSTPRTTSTTAATAQSGPSPTTPTTSPSTPTSAAVTTVARTYSAQGGTVTVRFTCGNNTTELVSATPAQGYTVEVKDDGPEQVDVEFESEGHESRIRARCDDGQPSKQIIEHDEA